MDRVINIFNSEHHAIIVYAYEVSDVTALHVLYECIKMDQKEVSLRIRLL
jgi:hypothetical protein